MLAIRAISEQIENPQIEKVASVLKQLMDREHIFEAELARQTNIPPATINRILQGGTTDPRASTLIAIAKFFQVSLEQLLGEAPLTNPRAKDNFKTAKIPLISWEQVAVWQEIKNSLNSYNHSEWVIIDHEIGDNCFGVISLRSMEPRFLTGSTLILDASVAPQDGRYVIVLISGKEPALRRIYKKGNALFLAGMDESLPPYPADPSDIILGTIIETRINMI